MDPETEQKLKILTDIVLSLARTSSERDVRLDQHDEMLDRLIRIVPGLVQTAQEHNDKITRILDIMAAQADTDEEIRRQAEQDRHRVEDDRRRAEEDRRKFEERNARVDRELDRIDEALAALIRTVDDWIRRQPPNGASSPPSTP